jgi:hypothetical protein
MERRRFANTDLSVSIIVMERARRVGNHQRKDFVGPQALKVERIGP